MKKKKKSNLMLLNLNTRQKYIKLNVAVTQNRSYNHMENLKMCVA